MGVALQRKHERSSLFSLNEGEDQLTHYGQSVEDMEDFDDVLLSDAEEQEEGAKARQDHLILTCLCCICYGRGYRGDSFWWLFEEEETVTSGGGGRRGG